MLVYPPPITTTFLPTYLFLYSLTLSKKSNPSSTSLHLENP